MVGLRKVGTEHNLPWGLLARAALRRVDDDHAGASADLTEALEIADRGSMLLFQCDAHLERTRLHLATHHDAGARRHLAIAKGIVEQTGYHRRDADVAFLEERLAASGSRGPATTAPPSGSVVSANPPSPGRGALAVWREKLEYFLEQEAVSADPAQKFALRKQIEEAQRRIRELGG